MEAEKLKQLDKYMKEEYGARRIGKPEKWTTQHGVVYQAGHNLLMVIATEDKANVFRWDSQFKFETI